MPYVPCYNWHPHSFFLCFLSMLATLLYVPHSYCPANAPCGVPGSGPHRKCVLSAVMLLQLRGLSTVQQLALGFSHSMSIGKHGDSYSWGTDENGSLGHGFKWPTVSAQHPTPVPVRLQSGAAGWKHTAGEAHRGRGSVGIYCCWWPVAAAKRIEY